MKTSHAQSLQCELLKGLHIAFCFNKNIACFTAENILVTQDGRLLLIDWGLSRVLRGECLESESTPEGTPYYMSPEVASKYYNRLARFLCCNYVKVEAENCL